MRSVRAAHMLVAAVSVACGSPSVRAVTSSDGVPIRYETHGAGSITLLMVHGWANDRTYWQPHIAGLSPNFRLITVDLPGFAIPAGSRQGWSMAQFGEDVAAVARDVGDSPLVLVGFSMGSAVVLEAARHLGSNLRGVVIVDAFHDPMFKFPESLAQQLLPDFRAKWSDTAFMRALVFSPQTPDSMLVRYIQKIEQPFPERVWPALMAVWEWNNAQLTAVAGQLRVPLFAINAAQPPTNLTAWRTVRPDYDFATIANVGHMGVIWEHVAEFDSLLTAAVRRFAR